MLLPTLLRVHISTVLFCLAGCIFTEHEAKEETTLNLSSPSEICFSPLLHIELCQLPHTVQHILVLQNLVIFFGQGTQSIAPSSSVCLFMQQYQFLDTVLFCVLQVLTLCFLCFIFKLCLVFQWFLVALAVSGIPWLNEMHGSFSAQNLFLQEFRNF